jgi:hypothetical protein
MYTVKRERRAIKSQPIYCTKISFHFFTRTPQRTTLSLLRIGSPVPPLSHRSCHDFCSLSLVAPQSYRSRIPNLGFPGLVGWSSGGPRSCEDRCYLQIFQIRAGDVGLQEDYRNSRRACQWTGQMRLLCLCFFFLDSELFRPGATICFTRDRPDALNNPASPRQKQVQFTLRPRSY